MSSMLFTKFVIFKDFILAPCKKIKYHRKVEGCSISYVNTWVTRSARLGCFELLNPETEKFSTFCSQVTVFLKT